MGTLDCLLDYLITGEKRGEDVWPINAAGANHPTVCQAGHQSHNYFEPQPPGSVLISEF